MKDTVVYKINNIITKDDIGYIKHAADIIMQGGLVAFPTETVYGLGGNALDKNASKKIYEAKGRPSDNPLIAHISDISQLDEIAKDIPQAAYDLAELFWPGPLTIILNKKEIVPYETTGGLDTVAVRMPDNPVALAFITEAGVPIAAPSANLSGKPSPTTAAHVFYDLNGRIDMILDGGEADVGVESTIVDLTGKTPVILRPGFVNEQMLEKVFDNVQRDPSLDNMPDVNIKPKAPGMKYRHYAPKGEMTIVSGNNENVINKINEIAAAYEEHLVGIITTMEHESRYCHGKVVCIGSIHNALSISHSLYGALRQMDEYGVLYIYIEDFPNMEGFNDNGLGYAIMNRVKKAAGQNIIYV